MSEDAIDIDDLLVIVGLVLSHLDMFHAEEAASMRQRLLDTRSWLTN